MSFNPLEILSNLRIKSKNNVSSFGQNDSKEQFVISKRETFMAERKINNQNIHINEAPQMFNGFPNREVINLNNKREPTNFKQTAYFSNESSQNEMKSGLPSRNESLNNNLSGEFKYNNDAINIPQRHISLQDETYFPKFEAKRQSDERFISKNERTLVKENTNVNPRVERLASKEDGNSRKNSRKFQQNDQEVPKEEYFLESNEFLALKNNVVMLEDRLKNSEDKLSNAFNQINCLAAEKIDVENKVLSNLQCSKL